MALETALAEQVKAAAERAGLQVVESAEAAGFNGHPTEIYTLARLADAARRQTLQLSRDFVMNGAAMEKPVADYMEQTAKRLHNPRPDLYVTLSGMPVSFSGWVWPFHLSTSGADTYIVHGDTRLDDGTTPLDSQLRAKISASMTVTFADVVPAPEQPFAEGFIYNAVRKIMDQGQIEFVKSGNRQPVPVTTRYYSAKQGRFVFNDTTEQQRQDYIATKVYWASGVLGGGAPVWVLDPRDAQYLNTTVGELKRGVEALAGDGIIQLQSDLEYAAATEPLRSHRAEYERQLADALAFTRPTFNEEMRSGQSNL